MACKALVIAAPMSGSGKTTVSLALMAALVRRGLAVAPFKIGPDFIDPGHHGLVCGRPSRNLDGWMLSRTYNLECFMANSAGADVAVAEGVMGLFDGADGGSEAGSTAQMAKWLQLPVVLVIDASRMARSAAALVHGFATFDPELNLAGVIFNRVAGPVHRQHLERAMADPGLPPLLGCIPRDTNLAMEERHLGLVTAQDFPLDSDRIAALATTVEKAIDIDKLLGRLPELAIRPQPVAEPGQIPCVRLAVARDQAFCFYYQDNLDLLARAGAEIVFFSPLRDAKLPPDIDGIYLGGGYPELRAAELSSNTGMRRQIRLASLAGMPVYAECGGFMYLGRSLVDLEGRCHPMCACLPLDFRMHKRLRRLGYRKVTLIAATILGQAGMQIKGHEFHYSQVMESNEKLLKAYLVEDKLGRNCPAEGYLTGRTLGSYVHLHWGSCPQAASGFVASCLEYRQLKK